MFDNSAVKNESVLCIAFFHTSFFSEEILGPRNNPKIVRKHVCRSQISNIGLTECWINFNESLPLNAGLRKVINFENDMPCNFYRTKLLKMAVAIFTDP